VLLLNRDFVLPGATREFSRRRALLGAVAVLSETHRYSLALLLLTAPAPEGNISIIACRPNGNRMYGGSAHLHGGTAVFSIRAVEAPGAFAVTIEGAFTDGLLEIRQAVVTPLARVEKFKPVED
jgi:hypothetical protein